MGSGAALGRVGRAGHWAGGGALSPRLGLEALARALTSFSRPRPREGPAHYRPRPFPAPPLSYLTAEHGKRQRTGDLARE